MNIRNNIVVGDVSHDIGVTYANEGHKSHPISEQPVIELEPLLIDRAIYWVARWIRRHVFRILPDNRTDEEIRQFRMAWLTSHPDSERPWLEKVLTPLIGWPAPRGWNRRKDI